MKQKYGYTIPELLIVIGVIGLIAAFSIIKVSFAFSETNNTEEQLSRTKSLVEQASILYAKSKEEEFMKEETFIFAKEVAAAGFLFEKEEYNTMKIKISYNQESKTFQAEVVE